MGSSPGTWAEHRGPRGLPEELPGTWGAAVRPRPAPCTLSGRLPLSAVRISVSGGPFSSPDPSRTRPQLRNQSQSQKRQRPPASPGQRSRSPGDLESTDRPTSRQKVDSFSCLLQNSGCLCGPDGITVNPDGLCGYLLDQISLKNHMGGILRQGGLVNVSPAQPRGSLTSQPRENIKLN